MICPRTILGAFLGIWSLMVSSFEFDPLSQHDLIPGQVITLNWRPSDNGKISLALVTTDNSNTIMIIRDTNNIGAYTWTVPADVPLDKECAIRIFDDDESHDNQVNHTSTMTDPFYIYSSSQSTSASASTDGTSKSTTMPTSAPTTLATAVSGSGNIPPTTTSPTDPSSTYSRPSNTPTDAANTGLSSSGRIGLIVCLTLVVPLTCVGLLFACYALRYPRREDTDERAGPTFFQWLIRRDHWPSKPDSPTDSIAAEKRAAEFDVRSSLVTHDSGMWHYKPELPGSDPMRESSTHFLGPVELPAWDPDELDPSSKSETKERREIHEMGGEEEATQSHTKAE